MHYRKCLILIVLLNLIIAFNSQGEKLQVGLVEYPPHLNFDMDNEHTPLYEYVNKWLNTLNMEVEYVRFPTERGIRELKNGNIDILFPLDVEIEGVRTLKTPLFHSVPGLCFKRKNFIPILSATHRFNNLLVGVPTGIKIVSALENSHALIVELKGDDAISRGIDLTQRGRIDAFYHPYPLQVYHRENTKYKEVACSSFHGYKTAVHIAVSPKLSQSKYDLIESAYKNAIDEISYDFYFATRDKSKYLQKN
jgi:hypothetical protein